MVDFRYRVLYPTILLKVFQISYFRHPCSQTPPIYIKNINNFSEFDNITLQFTGSNESNGILGKLSFSFPIIRPRRRSNYNAIHFRSRLDVYKRQLLYSFLQSSLLPWKIVIKNLFHTTLSSPLILLRL